MSQKSLLLVLLVAAVAAAQPPLRDAQDSLLSPTVLSLDSQEDPSSHPRPNQPLLRAPANYKYNLLPPKPRPYVVRDRTRRPAPKMNGYRYCTIVLSGSHNFDSPSVEVERTVIPKNKDVQVVFGNYCAKTGANVVGMQVVACDMGNKEKPYVTERVEDEDEVKASRFDVYGTPGGVVMFAKQSCSESDW